MSTEAEAQTQVESSPAPSQAPSEEDITAATERLEMLADALEEMLITYHNPRTDAARRVQDVWAMRTLVAALQSQTARAERAEEALADRVFEAGPLNADDGDTDSADPADWIISAAEHLERLADDKIEALQRVVVALADAHLSGTRLPDLTAAEQAVIATARNEVREYDDCLARGMEAMRDAWKYRRPESSTPQPGATT